jgi:hypothetical protein
MTIPSVRRLSMSLITWSWMAGIALGNSSPQVTNVTASQRQDGSKLVDIYYTLSDADGDSSTVWATVSDDGGVTYKFPAWSFTGHTGPNIAPGGSRHIIWDAGADMAGAFGSNFKVRVLADDGNGLAPMIVVPAGWFPYQNTSDPNAWVYVPTFLMDKYEVTNASYCQFLNAADPNSDHWASGMEISRGGMAGNYWYTVTAGKENYPIRYVSFYDAEAFATWRSTQEGLTYRLPSAWKWEKAAAWDPVEQHYYTYGFHRDSIDCNWCVYNSCYGSSPLTVGYLNGTGGRQDAKSYYGCYDMSGNVWEWTSEVSGSYRVIRGGAWNGGVAGCECSNPTHGSPTDRYDYNGFRLALDLN